MIRAINIAKKAKKKKKIPIGSILVYENFEIGIGLNFKKFNFHSASHAEINCLKQASFYLLNRITKKGVIYTTLQPCEICLLSLKVFNVTNIFFGTYQKQKKQKKHVKIHGGILKKKCNKLLKFFYSRK